MSEETIFEPITSQDQLDKIIGERVRREREATAKKYADYDEVKAKVGEYEKQITDLSKTLDKSSKQIADYEAEKKEMNDKILAYETSSVKMRIARETGLPYELAERLSGSTEGEIRKDAKDLAQYVSKVNAAPPLKTTEPPIETDKAKAAVKRMVANISTN